ncbi:MnmC family methyltransferase [Bdellovibrio sp. HCB2-146]|uniref:MnmC family methyltransferase n=1 Tax=Bdellovibrio sp. HCB2-146 TaxID=3394362 RepID=UPI0039BC30E1
MKSWADIGFEIEMTADGSPTLRLLESVDPLKDHGESMHHSAGACGETLLIYGTPARRLFEQIERPSFMVVGLGLGYIEMAIAKEALLLQKGPESISRLTSYESLPELREWFYLWLWGQEEKLSSEVVSIYEAAVKAVIGESSVRADEIKKFLRHHFSTLDKISSALDPSTPFSDRYHGIMYDAFSSKTSPYLWEEEFLTRLFSEVCAESSLVTTYSCKATLKNALRANQFFIVARDGFYGKRKSTIALRALDL